MTNHPEVQRKLRQHVLEHLPEIQDRPPTFEDLTKLPYLEAVVHETLRLSRTAGGYARESESLVSYTLLTIADTDVVILGKRIPKGTTIVIPTVTGWEDEANPIYTIPSRSDLHDAPSHSEALASDRANGAVRKVGYWEPGTGKLFQPERWLDAKGQFDPNAGPSLPFSLGQRACFGKNLAVSYYLDVTHGSCSNFACSCSSSTRPSSSPRSPRAKIRLKSMKPSPHILGRVLSVP